MPGSSGMSEFLVGIGHSRQWDAEKAGEEAIQTALKDLNGKPPKFVLVFTTIHYEKYGGFQKLLEQINLRLPRNTPVIGGTVSGFACESGLYSRGTAILAAYADDMDVAPAIGHNTKRNPRKAAREFTTQIKQALKDSQYENKLILEVTSGPVFPNIPGIGQIKVLKNNYWFLPIVYATKFSNIFLQKGAGRETEVLEELAKGANNYTIVGGSSTDDAKYTRNYQFFGNKVYTNTVVGVGICSQFLSDYKTGHGFVNTGQTWKPTKHMLWKHVICELNGKPATKQYLERVGWPPDSLTERSHTKTIFYPIGTVVQTPGGVVLNPNVIAIFLGDAIVLAHSIDSDELTVLTASGNRLIDAAENIITETAPARMIFGVSCAVRMEALGGKLFKTQESLKRKFKKFLVIYSSGEDRHVPGEPSLHMQETFNLLSIK